MGGRSRAAAQLLAGQGFSGVVNLQGGIKAWNGAKATGPVEMGMGFFRGNESSEEILPLAYGMEEGLRSLYESLAQGSKDPAVSGLFSRLAGLEEAHKHKLHRLYSTLVPEASDGEAFEEGVVSRAMEGGFTTEEFLERNRSALEGPSEVFSLAMMIEAQALDLYMRVAQKSTHEGTRKVLHELAEDEKAHLSTLGRMLETKT